MAKLKAPLLSLGASGAIGKSLVYFPWKGIDCVREYVVPSNPQTSAQTTQRTYLEDAVAKIHAAQARPTNPLDEEDQSAYSALGSIRATPRTWFNEVVKLWLDCKVLVDKPIVYSNFVITAKTRNVVTGIGFLNEETGSSLGAGKFYLGLTKTNLVHPVVASIAPGATITLPVTDIESWTKVGSKVYVQFRPDVNDDSEGANSGIYSFIAE